MLVISTPEASVQVTTHFSLRPFMLVFAIIVTTGSVDAVSESFVPASPAADSLYTLFTDAPLQSGSTQTPAATTLPAAPAPRGFFTRLGHAYLDDWTVNSNGQPPAPEPARRGTPAPLNSPPFPGADWPLGGTLEIGAPDYSTY